jgi:hypothetical protein
MWGTPSVVRRMVAWKEPSLTVDPFGCVALFDPLVQPINRAAVRTTARTVRVRLDPNEAPFIELTQVCHG